MSMPPIRGIFSNMYGPRNYHTKWNKSERKRQISYDIAHMWNLKKWYKWLKCKTEIDPNIENKFLVTEGERKGEG